MLWQLVPFLFMHRKNSRIYYILFVHILCPLSLFSLHTLFISQYADDKRCELEALEGKLTALQRVGVDKLQPSQKVEPVDTATKIISIVGEMKAEGAPASAKEKKAWQKAMKRNLKIQALAYQQLGHITLEGAQTKDDALKAMKYFGEYRDISKLIDNSTGVMTAEKNIALAGSKMANLGKSKSKINIFKTKDEKANMSAIRDGVSLAMDLKKIHRSIQAERMLTTLTATGKRVLGEEHSLTKRAEKDLKQYQVRYVQFKSQYEGKQFQALRYEEDGKKCVVQGPVTKPRKIKDEETMTVATADIKPVLGTPVVCHGLKDLSFLNGKIGDLQARGEESDDSYKVHFEDKKILPAEVKLENLRIVFELPEE